MPLVNHHLDRLYILINELDGQEVNNGLHVSYPINNHIKVKATLTHPINLGVFLEIFEQHTYAFDSILSDFVVVDVGMNMGFATLFFASLPNVKKVLAFELIPETAMQAQHNIALNPWAVEKCVVNNIAWSNYNGEVLVPVQAGGSAHTSIQNPIYNEQGTGKLTSVPVKKASDVLQTIIDQNPGQPVCLKLDCEGEEYNIIADLSESGLLKKVAILMLEWHQKGKQSLIDTLILHGFSCFSTNGGTGTGVGMIYAVNIKYD